jgi:uncharacterized protein
MQIGRTARIAGFSLLLAAPGISFAQDPAGLYQAQAIVTGQGEENRRLGFQLCLRDVLAKVSGDPRLLNDRRVEALLPRAGDLVASFSYRDRLEGVPIHDEQGTYDRPHDLTCLYEPGALDAVLAGLGSKPWLTERPTLAVFLAVQDQKRSFVLSRDGDESPYMGESLEAAAKPMAMTIAIPSAAELQSNGMTFEEVQAASPELWRDAAQELGGEAALIGAIRWSEADLGWIAHWRLHHEGRTFDWSVRGVSFDDAFRNAIRGSAQVLSGNGAPN